MTSAKRDGTPTVVPPMDAGEIDNALLVARAARPELIEQTGAWYWMDFADRPAEDVRADLAAVGWRWGHKKRRWYLPTQRSGNKRYVPMNAIREKYGSEEIDTRSEDARPARESAPAPTATSLF